MLEVCLVFVCQTTRCHIPDYRNL